MQYVPSLSNKLSKQVSLLVFGCAIPQMSAGLDSDGILDEAFRNGITVFDTAEAYGLSEVSLGNWIDKRKNRDEIVLITKGCHPKVDSKGNMGPDRMNPDALIEDIEQSFKRLKTDYIDIYFLHRDDLNLEVGPIIDVLNEYYSLGKIKEFGASNWSYQRIQAANNYAKSKGLKGFGVSSPNFGLCEQKADPWGGGSGCVSISGPSNSEARLWYKENAIPVFAYSAIGHGMLSGKVKSNDPSTKSLLDAPAQKAYYCEENLERLRRCEFLARKHNCTVSQIAIAWILNQTEVLALPIVSSSKINNIRMNIEAVDIQLSSEEVAWLDLSVCSRC